MSDLVSRVSSIAWSAEQCVVYFTLTVIGASIGLLEGTYKGFQRLQPNFRSREGLEELIYGSNHRGDRGSIKDLLLSWIPGAGPSKKQNQPNLKREFLSLTKSSILPSLRNIIDTVALLAVQWPHFPFTET
jgi:hypothetical protein